MQRSEQVLHERITVFEWRWVILFSMFVMLVTSIPYLVGFTSQNADWRFSGFVFGVEDGNSYIAKMRSGSAGAWLFRSPYSTAAQNGVVAFLPYLLLGKLLGSTSDHLLYVALFHVFRFLAGGLCVLATYGFIAEFISTVHCRRLAIALASLGGGLGWMIVLTGHATWFDSLPLEFYSPESFGFISLFGIPHLALGRAALMWGLRCHLELIQSSQVPTRRVALQLSSAWIVSALAQPLHAVIFGYVVALHMAVLVGTELYRHMLDHCSNWKKWIKVGIFEILAGLPAIMFVSYTLVAFSTDDYLQRWTAQNIIRSPHPLHYVLAYGWTLPLALPGALRLLRQDRIKGVLLVGWAASLPLLAYLPFNLQRRLPEGIWVALVALVVFQLDKPFSVDQPARLLRIRLILRWLYAGLLFPSTLVLLAGGAIAALVPGLPLFRPAAEVAAFNFLAQTAIPGEVVMSPYDIGNALPAWAPVRVVIGHGPETIGLAELEPQVNAFFMNPQAHQKFLREQDVNYVFYGSHEHQQEGAIEWEISGQYSAMEMIYNQAGYTIFRVVAQAR